MVSLFARPNSTSILPLSFQLPRNANQLLWFIFMLHPFIDFCIEVACYHDDVSLWDAIKSVLELVVKELKIIIRGCGSWYIDLNDWEIYWLCLDSDGDDPVAEGYNLRHAYERRSCWWWKLHRCFPLSHCQSSNGVIVRGEMTIPWPT